MQGGTTPFRCWMVDFHDELEADGVPFPVPASNFTQVVFDWAKDSRNNILNSDLGFSVEFQESLGRIVPKKLVWSKAWFLTPHSKLLGSYEVWPVWEAWEKWIEELNAKMLPIAPSLGRVAHTEGIWVSTISEIKGLFPNARSL